MDGKCEVEQKESCAPSSQDNCGCGSGLPKSQCCGTGCDHFGMMMGLAKCAKMELIKEKIKKKLEETQGKKLDKVADLLVEAMNEKMKTKMNIMKKKEEMKEKFNAIFMEG